MYNQLSLQLVYRVLNNYATKCWPVQPLGKWWIWALSSACEENRFHNWSFLAHDKSLHTALIRFQSTNDKLKAEPKKCVSSLVNFLVPKNALNIWPIRHQLLGCTSVCRRFLIPNKCSASEKRWHGIYLNPLRCHFSIPDFILYRLASN